MACLDIEYGTIVAIEVIDKINFGQNGYKIIISININKINNMISAMVLSRKSTICHEISPNVTI